MAQEVNKLENISKSIQILSDIISGKLTFIMGYGSDQNDGSFIPVDTYTYESVSVTNPWNDLEYVEEDIDNLTLHDIKTMYEKEDPSINEAYENLPTVVCLGRLGDKISFYGQGNSVISMTIKDAVNIFCYYNVKQNSEKLYSKYHDAKTAVDLVKKTQEELVTSEEILLDDNLISYPYSEVVKTSLRRNVGENFCIIPVAQSIESLELLKSKPLGLIRCYKEGNAVQEELESDVARYLEKSEEKGATYAKRINDERKKMKKKK